MTHTLQFRRAAVAVTLAAIVTVPACTLKDQETPPLAGPSEFGTSITMTATPDTITQDGASQSVILIVARDVNGQPAANLAMRMEMAVNGLLTTDFGRLSTQNPVTGADGRATVVYTAPAAPPDLNDPEPYVQFFVTRIGTNYDNAGFSPSVAIRLLRPAIAQVPGAPFPEFTYTPANPRVGTLIQFNAQLSTDPGGFIVDYDWDWGDGEQESGITQNHDFLAPGTYQVTLTVTDNSGLTASKTRTITVVP